MKCSSLTPGSSAWPALVAAAIFGLVVSQMAAAADVPMARAPEGPASGLPSQLRPLTEARLQKIILLNQANGLDQFITEPFAIALQLSKGGQKIVGRQTLIDLGTNKVIFNQLKGNLDGYTVGLVASDGIYVFRLDKNLNLIAAARKMLGADVAVVPEEQARPNLAVVFDLLAQVADKLEVADKP
jgi:hypothetical protein